MEDFLKEHQENVTCTVPGHSYILNPATGRDSSSGIVYDKSGKTTSIDFITLTENGFTDGVTSEQLLIVLKDRHQTLNKKFPCAENEEFLNHISAAIACLEKRTRDRMERKVLGKLQA